MDENNPALVAARSSWRCVRGKDKQGWLDLMDEDIRIEDPIGVAPTNPTGEGIHGKQAVAGFWDTHIGPSTILIEAHESFAVPGESAHVLTLTTTLSNGVTTIVHGIFTYRVNDAGRLASMRGYWTLDAMQFTPPPEAR
jgi:steroid delta-isomerase